MRASRYVIWGAVLLSLAGVAAADAPKGAGQSMKLDIASQPLDEALNQFAQQAGIQVIYHSRVAKGFQSPRIVGTLTPQVALVQLLGNTGLKYEYLDADTVRIFDPNLISMEGDGAMDRQAGEEKTVGLRLARWSQSQSAQEREAAAGNDDKKSTAESRGGTVQEIIVTATKRAESVQEVPVSVTALNQDLLERTGSDNLRDYIAFAPGVAYNDGDFGLVGGGVLTMRGIAAAFGHQGLQQTTEVFIDELPSLTRFRSYVNTDLRTYDVERIEILRGPQGTLFGSGAMGGAVRIVTNKPDPTKFSAGAELGAASTRDGDPTYSYNAMLNMPLMRDKMALRLVGYNRDEGGYIDNVTRSEENVNHVRSYGGRAMLSYKPVDALSMRFTVTSQQDTQDDSANTFYLNPGAETFSYDSVDPDSIDIDSKIYNLTAEYDMGFASLLYSTTYSDRDSYWLIDATRWAQGLFGTNGDVFRDLKMRVNSRVHELRLTSQGDSPFQWIAGLFYMNQDLDYDTLMTVEGLGAAFGRPTDIFFDFNELTGTEEKAVYGELRYKFGDRLTATAGARWFENTVAYELHYSGEFAGPPIAFRDPKESAFTPRFTLTYELSPDMNLYAQAAKGYRAGQNNYTPLIDPNTGQPTTVPPFYGPDTLWNYELGLKSLWLDNRVRMNISAFYIDWKDIQLTRTLAISSWVDNAGTATSKGVELEFQAALARWAEVGTAFTYTDAKMEEVLPGVQATPGQRLPGTAKTAFSNFIQFTTDSLPRNLSGYLRFDHRYVGKKPGNLGTPELISEAYNSFNVRTGAYIGNYEVALYVNNITDEDAILAPISNGASTAFTTRLRPRTIGVTFRADF